MVVVTQHESPIRPDHQALGVNLLSQPTITMYTALLLAAILCTGDAFQSKVLKRSWFRSSRLYDVIYTPKDDGSGLDYAERSRPFRRDVFAYDDWVRHRSSDRFAGRLVKFFQSGIVRGTSMSDDKCSSRSFSQIQNLYCAALATEIVLTTAVATIVCFGNALLAAGYDDLAGVHHDPIVLETLGYHLPVLSLPAMFFTLSSPALSLLLVFKTNTSYQRWDEARKNWGAIVNNSRTIMRQGAACRLCKQTPCIHY